MRQRHSISSYLLGAGRYRSRFGNSAGHFLSHQDANFVGQTIITQQNQIVLLDDSIKLNAGDAAVERVGIFNFDSISRIPASIGNHELAPKAWNAGIEAQTIALQFETQDVFQRGSIHPSGGTRVPGPTATARVRWYRVNVGGGDVGFDFVFVQPGARRSVVDRIQQSE